MTSLFSFLDYRQNARSLRTEHENKNDIGFLAWKFYLFHNIIFSRSFQKCMFEYYYLCAMLCYHKNLNFYYISKSHILILLTIG